MPERIVTNADLEKLVNTNDEWIRTRTGIEQRRWAEPGTATSELALPAVRECLDRRGLDPAELDLIVVATVTPDTVFPATACVLQEKLKARRAWGFDISAACSGFVYALTMGAQFVETGAHDKVLVVGADVMVALLLVLGGRDPPRGARRAPASLVPAIKTERPRPGQASAPRLVRPPRAVSPYRPA